MRACAWPFPGAARKHWIQKTLDEAAKQLGKEALVVQADVSNLADADKLFSAVEKRFGKIDVLFVNAGIAKFVPVEAVSE